MTFRNEKRRVMARSSSSSSFSLFSTSKMSFLKNFCMMVMMLMATQLQYNMSLSSSTSKTMMVQALNVPPQIYCHNKNSNINKNNYFNNCMARQWSAGGIVTTTSRTSQSTTQLSATSEDDVSKQLARARELLGASQAKLEATDIGTVNGSSSGSVTDGSDGKVEINGEDEESIGMNEPAMVNGNVPFFASKQRDGSEDNAKKEKVIKSKNDDGLITTDGDMMAEMSEGEEWKVRPLLDVFRNERETPGTDALADRDVAANIFNLRKELQTEDFQKIFDKRNRFIGEN